MSQTEIMTCRDSFYLLTLRKGRNLGRGKKYLEKKQMKNISLITIHHIPVFLFIHVQSPIKCYNFIYQMEHFTGFRIQCPSLEIVGISCGFLCIYTVAFLLFLASAGDSNLKWHFIRIFENTRKPSTSDSTLDLTPVYQLVQLWFITFNGRVA